VKIKFLASILLLFTAACSVPGIAPTSTALPAPLPVTTPTRAAQPTPLPTPAPAITAPTVRERIVTRELPGVGRAPVASVTLDGKTYVANFASDNVAIIQSDRITKFLPTGKRPSDLAIDPASKRIFVANQTDKTISIIANDAVALTTSIGEEPRTLWFQDNRLFVGLETKGTILVLDPATLQQQSAISIPNAFSVINLAGDATHHRLYAALFDKIGVIDSTTLRFVKSIEAKASYFTLLANPANDSVLTAMYDSTANAQFLTAFDPVSGATRGRVKIGGDPRDAVISSDGARIYVANSFSNTVSVIDARNLTALAEIPVGLKPYALALDENARRLFVANYGNDNMHIIDTQTNQVVGAIPLAIRLTALAANETTNRIYAASTTTDSVFVVENNRVLREVNAGRAPFDLARDTKSNRVLVANSSDNTLSIIDETNFAVRATQPITRFLSTVAVDSARGRVHANEVMLDANSLAGVGAMTARGVTINSVIAPDFVRINSNANRIYALGGNGVPGSNSRRVAYSIDSNTMQQRAVLAYAGNVAEIEIDSETNRVFLAGTHPLAFTHELGVFDVNDSKVFTLTLSAQTTGMLYNPQTRHLFLSQKSLPRESNQPPTQIDNTVLVLDGTTFGVVAQLNVNTPGKMTRIGNLIFVASRDDGTITIIEDVATPAPPSPTPTMTPTRFPTLTPPPPSPTRASSSASLPLCNISLAAFATQKWTPTVATRIGCPTENARTSNMAFQMFERGTMFWRESDTKIIVVNNDRSWNIFDDAWTSALPEDTCPGVSVAGVKPKRGFGKVWCEQASVRAKIGAGTSSEQGPYLAATQRFEHGQMFTGAEGGLVYVLFDGGQWE
jgi:YVTN family beta-propeller protein